VNRPPRTWARRGRAAIRAAASALVALLWAATARAAGPPAADTAGCRTGRIVRIDYFFEPGCADCLYVENHTVPELKSGYEGFYAIWSWDLGIEENYIRLVETMDRLGVDRNAHVYMLLNGRILLAGAAEINRRLFPELDTLISEELDRRTAGPAGVGPSRAQASPGAVARRRMAGFTLAGVLAGGLIDGVNPCAIATLVFLMSLLSVSGVSGSRLLLMGGAFCVASFLTYTAIGLGLLRVLYLLTYFQTLKRTVEMLLIACLVVLALLSCRDGFRYRKSGNSEDVLLRLPERLTNVSHALMRVGVGRRAQAVSAFLAGAGVTALESVCTGQVYVPTLALVIKSGVGTGAGLTYLLLYNLMFVLPLVIALALTYGGLKTAALQAWSRRNVFAGKLAMAAFFLFLAAVILVGA